MSTVDQIENAVRSLSPDDLAAFRAWFVEFDSAVWDKQIASDASSGRPDALADEALADVREGRCTDL
jgi:hypothetical protein